LIIDDHILFRQGMSRILAAEADMRVVGECGHGDEAIDLVAQTGPDVVLLDSDLIGSRAERTLYGLLRASPTAKVIIVTMHDQPRLVGNLLAAGAVAYVLKSSAGEELLATVRKIFRDSGHVVLSVSRQTLDGLNGRDRPLLSTREREILALVASGKRNSEIAGKLYISEGTVKRHLTNAYGKLGAASRIDAVKKAISLGLISFSDLLGPEDEK